MGEQISLPKVTLNILGASSEVSNAAQKILFVGQQGSSATKTTGELVEDISSSDINTFFGSDSLLSYMLRAAKDLNTVTQMDAIPLDDNGAGVAATGSFSVSGTATKAGTLTFSVGSRQKYEVDIDVAVGDVNTDIASSLNTALDALSNKIFTNSVNSGVVSVAMANKGSIGNYVGLQVRGNVAGITTSVVAMNGGATDPVLTNLFDPIDGVRYQTIVYPGQYSLTTLKTLLSSRLNVNNKILDGVGIISVTDSKSNLVSTYTAENEELIVVHANKPVSDTSYKGSAIHELDDSISAQIAALRALRLTADQSIANITVAGTNGARDSFGGDAIRSLPYFNTPFANLPLIDTGKGFTDSEVSDLNTAGLFVLGNNVARNSIIMGEGYTLYKTDAAGNPDNSFKFLNYVDTMSGIREYFFNNLKSRFAQSRLTTGAILPRRNMANEAVIRGYCTKLYNDLSGEDYVLTQAGEAALVFYKNNLSVILDLENRKVTLTMQTPIVTQLASIIGSIQLSFDTN